MNARARKKKEIKFWSNGVFLRDIEDLTFLKIENYTKPILRFIDIT